MRKTGKTGKSNRMRQEASYMAAKEQLTAMEMIWGFMSGTTGHMGKTDFAPQKEAFGDFASPETYFPRVVPESEGISSEKLTQMLRELAAARHTDMHHLLVLRNGHVICECNFAPYRSGIWHATYSMCKSITGMAVGFLISEGKLSLDENVYDIFEKRNGLLQKILRPNLTVEHLLTMKSGVQFNEMGVVSGNDWVDSFLNAPVKGTPGEAFEYNSMNTYLLSAIIQERTGMKMVDYLRTRLFEPLGIRKVFWESCPAGITKGGWSSSCARRTRQARGDVRERRKIRRKTDRPGGMGRSVHLRSCDTAGKDGKIWLWLPGLDGGAYRAALRSMACWGRTCSVTRIPAW